MKKLEDVHLAVVGHTEWVSFISVEKIPEQGDICHGNKFRQEPAGGGAVAAIQMSKLTTKKVHFFTALGNDSIGKQCYERLESLGIKVHVVWKNCPTRRGFSFVGQNAERAITIVGERIVAKKSDPLPWDILNDCDGIFVTATDSKSIKFCRRAKILCATPRVKAQYLNEANIQLDALIGSNLDIHEKNEASKLLLKPKVTILTEADTGGKSVPGGRYKAIKPQTKEIDSYGCGDSFAAGVTSGLAANLELKKAIELGARCGSQCATIFGPY